MKTLDTIRSAIKTTREAIVTKMDRFVEVVKGPKAKARWAKEDASTSRNTFKKDSNRNVENTTGAISEKNLTTQLIEEIDGIKHEIGDQLAILNKYQKLEDWENNMYDYLTTIKSCSVILNKKLKEYVDKIEKINFVGIRNEADIAYISRPIIEAWKEVNSAKKKLDTIYIQLHRIVYNPEVNQGDYFYRKHYVADLEISSTKKIIVKEVKLNLGFLKSNTDFKMLNNSTFFKVDEVLTTIGKVREPIENKKAEVSHAISLVKK